MAKSRIHTHIMFLKERDTWEFLKDLEKWSVGGEDERYLRQLFCLVEEQLGYPIYSCIEKTKIELGTEPKSKFMYKYSEIDIEMVIGREEFDQSVQVELDDIFASLNKVFEQSNLSAQDIDQVRITGGTGQMPLIRKRLEGMFGAEKINQAEVFQSVVKGLGRYAQTLG